MERSSLSYSYFSPILIKILKLEFQIDEKKEKGYQRAQLQIPKWIQEE